MKKNWRRCTNVAQDADGENMDRIDEEKIRNELMKLIPERKRKNVNEKNEKDENGTLKIKLLDDKRETTSNNEKKSRNEVNEKVETVEKKTDRKWILDREFTKLDRKTEKGKIKESEPLWVSKLN